MLPLVMYTPLGNTFYEATIPFSVTLIMSQFGRINIDKRIINSLHNNQTIADRLSRLLCNIVESFNGKLRDELINQEVFTTLTEAKILIEVWHRE